MKVEDIQDGMQVVGKDDYYQGLAGHIDVVRTNKEEFESENEGDIEIVVDFIETDDMSKTHPDLNGTGVDQLFMGEDELIFFPDGFDQMGYDIEGNTYQFDEVIHPYKGYKKKFS